MGAKLNLEKRHNMEITVVSLCNFKIVCKLSCHVAIVAHFTFICVIHLFTPNASCLATLI